VLRRDHHCPSLRTCVGVLNHKFFLQQSALQVRDDRLY
jgi:hypothetical protein